MPPSVPSPALERSTIYRGFADAFRAPGGGADVLDAAIAPARDARVEREFLEAFDPAISRRACALFESQHTGWQQAALFEELVRAYDHFGLRRKDTAELPDHICVELEFLHFLTFQEHLHASDAEAVASVRLAQHDFIERHLLVIARAVATATASGPDWAVRLTAALCAFLEDEMAALKA
jgi:DMSO reductase family type II enzyme chaperone